MRQPVIKGKEIRLAFQGYFPAQLGIFIPIDFAISSATELDSYLVMRDRLSNHGDCLQIRINALAK